MIIQHNISAINSHRQLGINNANTSKNLEKLSSGYRINRAGDDAAGLAISEKMRGQIRGLSMAEQNVSHGINLIQTAEGGLQETHAILQRMRELAVQSANGTYEDANDRFNLNKEVTALKEEIDRIAESTHYNNIKLLNGALSEDLRVDDDTQIGAGTIAGDVSIDQQVATDASEIDGTLSIQTALATKASLTLDVSGLINNIVQAVSSASTGGTGTNFTVTLGSLGPTANINIGDAATDTVVTAAVQGAINTLVGTALTGYSATITNGELKIELTGPATTLDDASLSALDGLAVSGQNVTAGSALAFTGAAEYADGTSNITAVTWTDRAPGSTPETLTAVNGEYSITKGGITVTFDIDALRAAADATLGTAATDTLAFGLEEGEGLTFQIGANGTQDQRMTIYVANTASTAIGSFNRDDTGANPTYEYFDLVAGESVNDISVATQNDANGAIEILDNAINYISAIRADLGAAQNRLEHTMNNLGVTKENLTAAESTIRDVDMAKEMMEYTKNSILVQASQAMLAQAQSLPQGVLNLLR